METDKSTLTPGEERFRYLQCHISKWFDALPTGFVLGDQTEALKPSNNDKQCTDAQYDMMDFKQFFDDVRVMSREIHMSKTWGPFKTGDLEWRFKALQDLYEKIQKMQNVYFVGWDIPFEKFKMDDNRYETELLRKSEVERASSGGSGSVLVSETSKED